METNKISNAIQFYLLATELKDKIRSGWVLWNVSKERIESVAEHIYGTCILAIAIDSEFDMNVDLRKVVMMIVLHELEEVKIGDLTPFDNVSKEEKRRIGKEAIESILGNLTKKYEYISLIEEFENQETNESIFAKMCDKLEADIQAKIYSDNDFFEVNSEENKHFLEDKRVQKLVQEGAKSIADIFIEFDRPLFKDTKLEQILDYVKNSKLKG